MLLYPENELYLNHELDWVRYRLSMLDDIELRLTEMRSIAILVRDSEQGSDITQALNSRFLILKEEVAELDEKSRTAPLTFAEH